MHCKQCGAEINDGAKFCGVCGTPTVAAAASAVGDAIYVEAQPIESQSVEAQFQAAEDAEAVACLQDSLHESIGSLGRAAVISLLYVLFFNYVLGGGSLGLNNMIPLALLLIGPWKVIISLYRSGVRLPFVYGSGIIGITIMLIACGSRGPSCRGSDAFLLVGQRDSRGGSCYSRIGSDDDRGALAYRLGCQHHLQGNQAAHGSRLASSPSHAFRMGSGEFER